MGVNEDAAKGKEIGAGDQGLMFGYACNDTPELMPLPIALAHRILNRLTEARQKGEVAWLRPDSKSQVTVEYDGHRPVRIDTVVVSTQHAPDVSQRRDSQVRHREDRQAAAAERAGQRRHHVPHQSDRPVRGRRPARRLRPDRAARSSSTPTAAGAGTAAAPSAARTRPRSTAAPPTWPGTWPRTSSPPAWPTAAKCSWPTPSASPSRSACCVDTEGTGKIDDERLCELVREVFPLDARRDHQVSRPAPADLPQDGRRRTLRPQRARVHLGEHAPRRRAGRSRGRGRRGSLTLTARGRESVSSARIHLAELG